VNAQSILQNVMSLIPMLLSLTVHEFAHAWSAYKLGDDTAARQGRLTLNPLVHMDPLGTFLLPLLGIPFGWAKPVPVNPTRFRRDVSMGFGMMLTAIAGPGSNLLLAVLCAVIQGLVLRWAPDVYFDQPALMGLLRVGLQMNVVLAIFNMLPVPPLDGSRVVEWLLPYRYRDAWSRFSSLSPLLLMLVMFTGGALIAGPSQFASALLDRLVRYLALPSVET
jgi:Zn-dependent protease